MKTIKRIEDLKKEIEYPTTENETATGGTMRRINAEIKLEATQQTLKEVEEIIDECDENSHNIMVKEFKEQLKRELGMVNK